MSLHANAALSLKGRRELCGRVVEQDWTLTEAAASACVSVRCARKWVGRRRVEGQLGLLDRSPAAGSISYRTSEERVEAIAALRRLRFTGPEIETLKMALSTVSGVLARIAMGKLGRLGLEPAVRYERERPGELIHIDTSRSSAAFRAAPANALPASPWRPSRRRPGTGTSAAAWGALALAARNVGAR
jgi:hypothetical protein